MGGAGFPPCYLPGAKLWWRYRDLSVKVKSLCRVQLFATPWTVAHQAPQSMGFSRQEYWMGLPFPSPGDNADPGIKPTSPALAGGFFATEPPGKPSRQWFHINTPLSCVHFLLYSLDTIFSQKHRCRAPCLKCPGCCDNSNES